MSERTSGGRVGNVVLWILQVLAALGFLFAAFGKLTRQPATMVVFERMGTDAWLPIVIAVLEIAGAIGLLIPRFVRLAAVCLAALMVGALITHAVLQPEGIAGPIPFLVLTVIIAIFRRRSAPRTTHET